jgi:hypothetical protein
MSTDMMHIVTTMCRHCGREIRHPSFLLPRWCAACGRDPTADDVPATRGYDYPCGDPAVLIGDPMTTDAFSVSFERLCVALARDNPPADVARTLYGTAACIVTYLTDNAQTLTRADVLAMIDHVLSVADAQGISVRPLT